jgi:hypothetical protein
MVPFHAALSEQLLHVAVRQPEPQLPPHCHDDHLGRKPEAGEDRAKQTRGTRTGESLHRSSVPDLPIGQCNSAPPTLRTIHSGQTR